MNILIVDDLTENICLLQALLEGAGYGVVSAGNGREALERLREGSFDLIVSDILMPVMDGFQLCRECKTNPGWKDIPFVFYTATYTEKKDEDFALTLGADRFVIKPQDPERILKVISQVLAHPGRRAATASSISEIDEMAYLSEHNKRLVEKLENKMAQLEETNRSLQASEKKYRLLAENAQDVIFVLDQDLNYTYISPSVKLLRGYDPDEVEARVGDANPRLLGTGGKNCDRRNGKGKSRNSRSQAILKRRTRNAAQGRNHGMDRGQGLPDPG